MAIRDMGSLLKDILKRLTALERRTQGRGRGSGGGVPIGSIVLWYADDIPEGWLECNGQLISSVNYPQLREVLSGTTVPDLRGRVPVGMHTGQSDFNTLGKIGGSATHTLTVNEMPSHNHSGSSVGNRGVNGDYSNSNGTSLMSRIRGGNTETGRFSDTIPGSSHNHPLTIASQGGGAAHNNLQPYRTMRYIIRAK